MTHLLPFAAILFLAAFTQSLTGFGQALVAMPLLVLFMDVRVASPLVAMMGVMINLYILAQHRQAIQFREISKLMVGALLGIPTGVWALRHVDQRVVLGTLGLVLICYAAYGLAGPRLPRLASGSWAYPFGFVSGLLGGAYNTSGPPAVIYAGLRGWEPTEFRANLQGFFLLGNSTVLLTHLLANNVKQEVWRSFLYGVVPLGLGLWLGCRVDRYLQPALFRKVVLVMLIAMGVNLLI